MIPYIGDISAADAIVLRELAEKSCNTLEFGCGASTQVISTYTRGTLTSIDTSQEWINKTIGNIGLLEIKYMPTFMLYDRFKPFSSGFDFVFDDGADDLRRDFSMMIWPHIKLGGCLAFHDTRRSNDLGNVIHFINTHQYEISRVDFNYKHSNISIIYKHQFEHYVDWNIVEGRAPWQTGWGNPDLNYIRNRLENEHD
jgi:predicted O-methyltransferase YrrM